jgi:hypothetical protein
VLKLTYELYDPPKIFRLASARHYGKEQEGKGDGKGRKGIEGREFLLSPLSEPSSVLATVQFELA